MTNDPKQAYSDNLLSGVSEIMNLKLFEILSLKQPELDPSNTKIHLNVENEDDNYFKDEDKGEGWCITRQKREYFKRGTYIVELVRLSEPDKWLFIGCYESYGCGEKSDNHHKYSVKVISSMTELTHRIIVSFEYSSQNYFPNAKGCSDKIFVHELLPEKKISVAEFQGYNKSLISKPTLDTIVQQNSESWCSALSNVIGVYLVTDTFTGKLYVGSATGEGGIWSRWCEYSKSGHGGNEELKGLLKEKSSAYSSHFQYSVLEIADTHTNKDAVLERESYWKKVLCSKEHGYNAN